jgi:hypothetical protein
MRRIVAIPMVQTLWQMRPIQIDPVIDKNMVTKTFVPWDHWIKLLQEQKDKLIAERHKELMNSNNGEPRTPYPTRQASGHEVDEVVDIDDIIDYNMLNHDGTVDDYDNNGNTTDGDGLLVYMADRSSSTG